MRLIAVLSVLLVLAGCATTPGGDGKGALASAPASQMLLARAGVQYAVDKYVGRESTPEAQERRRARVEDITAQAIEVVDRGLVATIPALEEVVRSRIDWAALDLSDRRLLDTLIAVVRVELEARMQPTGDAPVLDAGLLLDVREVLGWIHQAAATQVPNG